MKLFEIHQQTFNIGNKGLTAFPTNTPKEVDMLMAHGNQLSTFDGAPEKIGAGFLKNNKFSSLHNIHKHIKSAQSLYFDDNDIVSSVLGLLLIDGLQVVTFNKFEVFVIINNYLPNHRGMEAVLECQEELINAGFEEYAQL